MQPTLSIPALCSTLLVAAVCGVYAFRTLPPSSQSLPAGVIEPVVQAASVRPPLPGSYAALGASETFGIGASPYTQGYAYRVARAIGARHFVDLGIPGATIHEAYDTEISGALLSRPALATLFFGFNDIVKGVKLSSYVADLHDLVVTLQRARARVLIIALPDLSQLPSVKQQVPFARAIIDEWNGAMQRVARQTHAAFLNLAVSRYSAELGQHPDYIAADGLHPSNRGHARLAQIVVQAIHQDGLWPHAGAVKIAL